MYKGIVSAIQPDGRATVLLPDRDNAITAPLPVAPHVGTLTVGKTVAIALFAGLTDGIVLAAWEVVA